LGRFANYIAITIIIIIQENSTKVAGIVLLKNIYRIIFFIFSFLFRTFKDSLVKALYKEIIFIGVEPLSSVRSNPNEKKLRDKLKPWCHMLGMIPFPIIAFLLIFGVLLPITLNGSLSKASAELPTESNPDIDIETVRLGKGSFVSGGIRILADLEPFYIIDGHVEYNAPPDARDVKVVVAESTKNSISHAVILNPTMIKDVRTGEALFHVDLDERISGKNPWTGRSDKVDNYNNVYLMNIAKGKSPISFNDQSQATITVVFAHKP
jgi:hypothetical protein